MATLLARLCAVLLLLVAVPARAELSYDVRIEGPLSEELEVLLPEVSQLVALKDRPVNSRSALERRVQRDLELFAKALQSKGYYGAQIAWQIEEGTPPVVVLKVEPGERFVLAHVEITFPPGADLTNLPEPSLAELGIELGVPAEAENVLAAESRLIDYLQNNGYPLAKAGPRRVTVDLASAEMSATLQAEPGPPARFGTLTIDGLDRLEEPYLREILHWPEGEVYSAARLERVRRDVVAMGLYDSVSLDTAAEPAADGSLAATLTVVEAAPRSVGVGLSYSTGDGNDTQGFTVDAFWEHRNIFGEAESLRFETSLSLTRQRVAALFRKPNWLDDEQTLLLNAELRQEQSDAFSELGFLVFGGVERPLSKHLTLTTGVALEALKTGDQDTLTENFIIGSVPSSLNYDNRDDVFNPTNGLFAIFSLTPALVTLDRTTPYVEADLGASTYWAPFEDDSLVFAVRGRVASIMGSGGVDAIPASKRLYSGGGGSVRGYDVDSLGPLDSDNDPTGGRSLFEGSLEVRTRFLEDYGLVAFLDAGQVYAEQIPTFTDPLFAAGVGFRYFTAIGPVRLDVAIPLNPRPSDASYQFYVSIGQSF